MGQLCVLDLVMRAKPAAAGRTGQISNQGLLQKAPEAKRSQENIQVKPGQNVLFDLCSARTSKDGHFAGHCEELMFSKH